MSSHLIAKVDDLLVIKVEDDPTLSVVEEITQDYINSHMGVTDKEILAFMEGTRAGIRQVRDMINKDGVENEQG